MKISNSTFMASVILGGVTLALGMTCVAKAAGPIQQAGLFANANNNSYDSYNTGNAGDGSDGGYCPNCNAHGRGIGGCSRCRVSVRAPVLNPVGRYPKVYQNYWADHLYKDPGSAVRISGQPSYPMVAMPTDTTQLGFYPVHVPSYSYRPEMLPPAPRPGWAINRSCN